MKPCSLTEFMTLSSASTESTCTFLHVDEIKLPRQLYKYSPQSDHERIALQHSKLKRSLSIDKIGCPDPALPSVTNCIVCILTHRYAISKFPDVIYCHGTTS